MPDAIAIWSNDGTIRRPSARSRNSAAARPRMGVGATVISQCRACKGCCCRPLGSWHSSTLGGHEHRFNRGRYCSVGGLQSLPLSLGDGVVTNSLEPRLLWNGIEGLDGPTAPGLLALSRGIDTGCGQRGRASRGAGSSLVPDTPVDRQREQQRPISGSAIEA